MNELERELYGAIGGPDFVEYTRKRYSIADNPNQKEKFAKSEMVKSHVGITDAEQNLSSGDYKIIYEMIRSFLSDNEFIEMDAQTYFKKAIEMISQFDMIASYQKYYVCEPLFNDEFVAAISKSEKEKEDFREVARELANNNQLFSEEWKKLHEQFLYRFYAKHIKAEVKFSEVNEEDLSKDDFVVTKDEKKKLLSLLDKPKPIFDIEMLMSRLNWDKARVNNFTNHLIRNGGLYLHYEKELNKAFGTVFVINNDKCIDCIRNLTEEQPEHFKKYMRLNDGERVNFSKLELVLGRLNFENAKQNLSDIEYANVMQIYNIFKTQTITIKEVTDYHEISNDIIRHFAMVAPLHKFCSSPMLIEVFKKQDKMLKMIAVRNTATRLMAEGKFFSDEWDELYDFVKSDKG